MEEMNPVHNSVPATYNQTTVLVTRLASHNYCAKGVLEIWHDRKIDGALAGQVTELYNHIRSRWLVQEKALWIHNTDVV